MSERIRFSTLLLLVCGAVIAWTGCAGAKTKLVIQDNHVGAWVTTSNEFANHASTNPQFDPWHGLLFQLGRYESIKGGFTEVRIVTRHGAPQTFGKNDVLWVNIVAPWDPAKSAPMMVDDVPYLMDTGSYPTTPGNRVWKCADEDRLAGKEICEAASCNGNKWTLDPSCLRIRRIHHDLTPSAVLTYWNGPKGFDVETRTTGTGSTHLASTFEFRDPVIVQVWKANATAPAFESSEVKSIEILFEHDEPNHGASHDPVWPDW